MALSKTVPIGTIARAETKLQRHFDRNHDSFLSRREYELLRTHLYQRFPLAQKISEKAYDLDDDGMLEPFEAALYSREKGTPSFKKRLLAYKQKRREQRREERGNRLTPQRRPLY